MTKDNLIKYCKDNDIYMPKDCTKEYLEAVIVRYSRHKKKINSDTCYGFWAEDEGSCLACEYEEKCFRVSIGMDKDTYFKKYNNHIKKVRL